MRGHAEHDSCRNQASATAAVQAAAQMQQQPQLSSLLVEPSWLKVLGPEFDKPYMQQLQGFLEQEWGSQTIYPPNSIFRAFNAVPFDQVGGQHA
jgi:uracil-DNA glycosylase